MHPKRRVLEGLGDGHIRVLKICIFPDQSDGHFVEESFLAVKKKKRGLINKHRGTRKDGGDVPSCQIAPLDT